MSKRVAESHHDLNTLIATQRLIICVGSGGVGKTTTAAAIGIQAAQLGKRVLVITIDPARRLANALGLSAIGNRETEISPFILHASGVECRGSLHAMMLDTSTTFDDLVSRIAPDEATRDKILNNNVYRQISGTFSATQEYMASEKLYDVYVEDRYDLIVLDTPPMKNAIDFLEAPQKVVRFLDDKIIKWFVKPIKPESGFIGKRLLSSTGAVAYKLLGYVLGGEFLGELNEFFMSFSEMTRGFRIRSEKVEEILRAPTTSFLVVCGPRRTSVEDARHFASQLRARHLPEGGLIVNQVRSYLIPPVSSERVLSPEEESELLNSAPDMKMLLSRLDNSYRWLHQRSEQDQRAVAELRRLNGGRGVFQVVPRMWEEINDIPGLMRLNSFLFSSALRM